MQALSKEGNNIRVFVSKIPKEMSDALIERILKICGSIESWKRSTNAAGKLQSFGFCHYEDIKSVLLCENYMSDLQLLDSRLKIKLDKKTSQILQAYRSELKDIWMKQHRDNQTAIEEAQELEQRRDRGEKGILPPWERMDQYRI